MSSNCHSALLHGATRKTFKGILQINNKDELQTWEIPQIKEEGHQTPEKDEKSDKDQKPEKMEQSPKIEKKSPSKKQDQRKRK